MKKNNANTFKGKTTLLWAIIAILAIGIIAIIFSLNETGLATLKTTNKNVSTIQKSVTAKKSLSTPPQGYILVTIRGNQEKSLTEVSLLLFDTDWLKEHSNISKEEFKNYEQFAVKQVTAKTSKYAFTGIKQGSYKIVAYKEGYSTEITPLITVTKTKIATLNIQLEKDDPKIESAKTPKPVGVLEDLERSKFIEPGSRQPRYNGYIIEYKTKSVVEYRNELKKQVVQSPSAKRIDSIDIPEIKPFLEEKIMKQQTVLYREILEKENQTIENDIASKLLEFIPPSNISAKRMTGKTLLEQKTITKFKNVFSGIALDISHNEAKKIRESPYVKAVYPNYEVKTTLSESIALIKADKVWQLNTEGKSCKYLPDFLEKLSFVVVEGNGSPFPLPNAIVYLFDTDGKYINHKGVKNYFALFDDIPVGEYKAIAVADGFLPSSEIVFSVKNAHVFEIVSSPEKKARLQIKTNEETVIEVEDVFGKNFGTQKTINKSVLYTNLPLGLYTIKIVNLPKKFFTVVSLENQSIEIDLDKSHELLEPSAYATVLYESQNQCLTGKGITIGIIDTGVDYTHLDLGGCLGTKCKVVSGYDFINKDNDPMDDQGHGTHVAAIAAGNGLLRGVAPDAKIVAYKVFNKYGEEAYTSVIISAIERSIDPNQDGDFSDHLDVINLSLGGFGNPDDPLSQAIDRAATLGVVPVVAAGNDGPNFFTISSPGTARKAITVGASSKDDKITNFSSRGPTFFGTSKPDIVAPGFNICAAQSSLDAIWETKKLIADIDIHCIDKKHIALSGTSMATPHVAGAVALIKQAHPEWTSEGIKNTLRGTSKNLGFNFLEQGRGRIDVLDSVSKQIPYPTAFINSTRGSLISEPNFKVDGDAFGKNFDSFALEYANWSTTNEWQTVNESTTEVYDGLLGTINLKKIGDAVKLKLKIKTYNEQESTDEIVKFPFVKDDHNSWIRFFPGGLETENWCNLERGVIADIDTDGKPEIIISNMGSLSFDAKVFVFKNNGELMWSKEGNTAFCTPPSVGNIDKDKELEIIYKDGTDFADRDRNHYIFAWNHDGSDVSGWPIENLYENPSDSPVLADIDNDGIDEIIVQKDKKLSVIKGNGTIVWSASIEGIITPFHSPVVIDLDNDGKKGIIHYTINDLYVWNSEGALLWKNKLPAQVFDGEVMFSAKISEEAIISIGPYIYSKKGKLLFTVPNYQFSMFADIDNDKKPELITIQYDFEEEPKTKSNFFEKIVIYKLKKFNNNIRIEKLRELNIDKQDLIESYKNKPVKRLHFSRPFIGDIDNDKKVDIIVFVYKSVGELDREGYKTNVTLISNKILYAFDTFGNIIKGYPKTVLETSDITNIFMPKPIALFDIDNDNKLELVYILGTKIYPDSYLAVTDILGAGEKTETPMLRYNAQNTGFYDAKKNN